MTSSQKKKSIGLCVIRGSSSTTIDSFFFQQSARQSRSGDFLKHLLRGRTDV